MECRASRHQRASQRASKKTAPGVEKLPRDHGFKRGKLAAEMRTQDDSGSNLKARASRFARLGADSGDAEGRAGRNGCPTQRPVKDR